MELQDALTQISEIRRQVARTEIFRGFKALPVAFSGVLALTAAVVQYFWLPDPRQNLFAYLWLWIGAAMVSLLATGLIVILHCRHSPSPLTRTTALLVVGQFLPCVGGGGLVTFILFRFAPEILWVLPGLWAVFFSLGIFATYRLLPWPTFYVGLYYMLTGLAALAWGQGEWAFSPWAMAVPFGVGQLLAASILYWTLERNDETQIP